MIALAEGGRRSGKTTGALAPKLLVCMLVFAGLPGEVLSPTHRQTKNVRRAILKHTPQHWWATWPQPETPPIAMTMVMGSTVTMLTAANQDSARSEGVAWGAYDERQDIPEEAFSNALLSTSEAGDAPYIFETATIKPELRPHHDALESSDIGHVYPMDSYGNPFTNKRFLEIAEELLDEDTIDREIKGKWPSLFGRIFWNWEETAVESYPAPRLRDATESFLVDRFNAYDYQWYLGIDPPGTAGLFKIYDDESLHLVHEVLAGADGKGTGPEEMVRQVVGLVGTDRALIVQDPHEHKWDVDVIKLFRAAGVPGQFKFVSMRPILQTYKHAAVRARARKGKLLVSPRCPHAIEVLQKHVYKDDGSGKPDKLKCYSKSHQKESKRIQLVHLGDVLGYACYKAWPTRLDYERMEREHKEAA